MSQSSSFLYWLRLVSIYASVCLVAMGGGMSFPILALELERRGQSHTVIGLFTSTASLAILLSGVWIPKIAARLGLMRTIGAGLFLGAVCFVSLPFLQSVKLWFVLRFFIGMGWAAHWLLTEVWINSLAFDHNRGRVLALYSTFYAGGLSGGPLILSLVGSSGLLPYFVVVGLIALGCLCLFGARHTVTVVHLEHEPQHGARKLIRLVPIVFVAAMASGLFEATAYALLPLYGLGVGFNETQALRLLTMFVLGNVVLQLPIAWIAGRIGLQKAVCLTALIGMLGALVIPWLIAFPGWLSLLLFVWGGIVFGTYVLGLTMLGHTFKGPVLSIANATFIVSCELGSLVGPFVGGLSMDMIKPHGLVWVFVAFASVLLVAALWRPYHEPQSEQEYIEEV